jgi:hypothetical protein
MNVGELSGKSTIIEDFATEAPVATGVEHAGITVKVRDQTGDEIAFKVRHTTPMSKIFAAYAVRRGVPVNALRFFLDDRRLKDADTPKMLEMEEDDQIDVYLEQLGGKPCPPCREILEFYETRAILEGLFPDSEKLFEYHEIADNAYDMLV